MIIDTHCHVYCEYYDDINEIIEEMKDNIIVINGTNDINNKEIVNLCNKYNNVYGALGIHPEEMDKAIEDNFKYIETNLDNPKIVAVGEIGLDYHYVSDNKEKQIELFKKQIEIAIEYNKPVIVHSRDAIKDTYDILKSYNVKAIIHCYSSSLEMANEFIKLGHFIGIGGVVTFKNSQKLKEIVKIIDLNHLLLETDSPFLAPTPYRGKKNKPLYVNEVAKEIADIKGINVSEVISKTTETALNLFKIVR